MTNDGKCWRAKTAFRKFLPVYQHVTSLKRVLFETIIYFYVVSWDIREKCSNFASTIRMMVCWELGDGGYKVSIYRKVEDWVSQVYVRFRGYSQVRSTSVSGPFQIRSLYRRYKSPQVLVATRNQHKRKEPTPMAIRTSSLLSYKSNAEALCGNNYFFSSTGSCISFFERWIILRA